MSAQRPTSKMCGGPNPRCVLPAARCFPPPWLIEEHNDTCFIVKNAQGTGYLLPTNFGGCIQLRRPDPDLAKINRVMRNFSFVVGVQGTIQALTISHGPFCDWP
jgi:hypothetical protein